MQMFAACPLPSPISALILSSISDLTTCLVTVPVLREPGVMEGETTHWKKPKGVIRALNAFDKKETKSRERETGRWKKPKGVIKALNAFDKKGTTPRETGRWKKPKGVVRALNAFDKKGTTSRETGRWKKPKGVIRALSAFDKKGTTSGEIIPEARIRKVGQVGSNRDIRSKTRGRQGSDPSENLTTDDGEKQSNDRGGNCNSPVSSVSSGALQRGILKNNSIIHKASNTVKFRQENEINSSESKRRKVQSKTVENGKKENNRHHSAQQQTGGKFREALNDSG